MYYLLDWKKNSHVCQAQHQQVFGILIAGVEDARRKAVGKEIKGEENLEEGGRLRKGNF